MNTLTSTILANHSRISVKEAHKQGSIIPYEGGKTQRIVNKSIPSIEMTIEYAGLTISQFEVLRGAYESNHSNTFIVDADDIHDLRPDVMGINSSVWAFKDFKFKGKAPSVFNGTITLVSSVFFNYSRYQDHFSQSSTYTPVVTLDSSFDVMCASANPYEIEYSYSSNSMFSNIGKSVRHIKDRGGLKKVWRMKWLLQESDFLELLKFYRMKAGILGEFGVRALGSPSLGTSTVRHTSHFLQDSFKYDRQLGNIYKCRIDIVEVV